MRVRMLVVQMAVEEQGHAATWPRVASAARARLGTAPGNAEGGGGTASSQASLPGNGTGHGDKPCSTLYRWPQDLNQRRDSCQGKAGGAGIRVAVGLIHKDNFRKLVWHREQRTEPPVQLRVQPGGGCRDGAGASRAALGFHGTWVRQETRLPACPACVWVTTSSAVPGCYRSECWTRR